MIKNLFRTPIRRFRNRKAFTLINIAGLATGISAALVIFLIVYYEYSFDRFEKNPDRIYRVVIDARFNGVDGHSAGVHAPLAKAITREMTAIQETIPVMGFQGDGKVNVEVTRPQHAPLLFKDQERIVFTNDAYFRVFPYHFLAGSPESALQAPFSVVLTRERAHQYFPGLAPGEVVGKSLVYHKDVQVTVSGIVDSLPERTDFSAKEFISYATIEKTNLSKDFMMQVWDDWMAYSMLLVSISPGASAATAEAGINALLKKYNPASYRNADNYVRLHLQPLRDIHFNFLYQSPGIRTADAKTMQGLLVVAAFLLLLAVINFINLTTAQAAGRAKEIGIRKTMGSTKQQLLFQFLEETWLLTLLAAILSVALLPLFLHVFQSFIPPGLSLEAIPTSAILAFLLLLVIVVGFAAGIYPALVLSRYKPISVLKSQSVILQGGSRSAVVRKVLTVAQFGIAQFFLIATLLVAKQINYALQADVGFNHEAVVTAELPPSEKGQHRAALMQELSTLPGVAMVSSGFLAPADKGMAFTNIAYFDGHKDVFPPGNVQIRWGDDKYINVYQMPLLAGRNLLPSDSIREFLINETYAHAIGFANAADALGVSLSWNKKHIPVVGILRDFHDQSMRAPISAVVLGGSNGSTLHIRLKDHSANAGSWPKTMAAVETLYHRYYPGETFTYNFVDDMIAGFYSSEKNTASILSWATGMAIFISCIGLLGLALFSAEVRLKEIGIRKVLGASVTSIVALLSADMLKLVVLAFLIAAPLAGWAMYRWLQHYAFKTTMSWWIFALAGTGMLAVALLTLAMQTMKAARMNPVHSLRSE